MAGAARRLGAAASTSTRSAARCSRCSPSFVGHLLGGWAEQNAEQRLHGQAAGTLVDYATSSRFWFESLQNWQSEFLSVGAMVWLAVYLRQRGSPESKPVHAPHAETGR